MLTPEQTAKFWGKVRKGNMTCDCWQWTGARCGKYGAMSINNYYVSVHRISYILNHGPIDQTKYISQTCNNDLCVNPAHLKLLEKKSISRNKNGSHVSFDERCKKYNEKFPFRKIGKAHV